MRGAAYSLDDVHSMNGPVAKTFPPVVVVAFFGITAAPLQVSVCKGAKCTCRCILKAPLPAWPHCNDHLTVWRRVQTCTVNLSGAADQIAPRSSAAESTQKARRHVVCLARSNGAQVDTECEVTEQHTGGCEEGDDGRGTSKRRRVAAFAPDSNVQNSRNTEPASNEAEAIDGEDEDSDAESSSDELEFVCDARAFRRVVVHSGGDIECSAVPTLLHLLAEPGQVSVADASE